MQRKGAKVRALVRAGDGERGQRPVPRAFRLGDRKGGGLNPCRGRNQLVLDFTRGEVVDTIFENVSKILRENDISSSSGTRTATLRKIIRRAFPRTGRGEFWHRYTLGFYDLAERLRRRSRTCFSKAARRRRQVRRRGIVLLPADLDERRYGRFGKNEDTVGHVAVLPAVSSMSCHVSACPNHQTQRTTPFATRGAIASLGATGYELDLTKLSEEEKEQVKEQIKNYKQIDELVLKAICSASPTRSKGIISARCSSAKIGRRRMLWASGSAATRATTIGF